MLKRRGEGVLLVDVVLMFTCVFDAKEVAKGVSS
jgi:hypothetical protein